MEWNKSLEAALEFGGEAEGCGGRDEEGIQATPPQTGPTHQYLYLTRALQAIPSCFQPTSQLHRNIGKL